MDATDRIVSKVNAVYDVDVTDVSKVNAVTCFVNAVLCFVNVVPDDVSAMADDVNAVPYIAFAVEDDKLPTR